MALVPMMPVVGGQGGGGEEPQKNQKNIIITTQKNKKTTKKPKKPTKQNKQTKEKKKEKGKKYKKISCDLCGSSLNAAQSTHTTIPQSNHAMTRQSHGPQVFAFSFNNLYSSVYRRPVLSVVRLVGALAVLMVGPHFYLHLRVTSWWGIPKGFVYRIIFMYGRFLDLAFLAFRWQLGMSVLFVTLQTGVVGLVVLWSHRGCHQLIQTADIQERLVELKDFGERLTPAAITKTCEVAAADTLPSQLTKASSAICSHGGAFLGAVARMPSVLLCVGIRVLLSVLLGLVCPLVLIFRHEYVERKQFAMLRGMPLPPSVWPAVVHHFCPVVVTVAALVAIDRLLAGSFAQGAL
jgi:hypothetical protein